MHENRLVNQEDVHYTSPRESFAGTGATNRRVTAEEGTLSGGACSQSGIKQSILSRSRVRTRQHFTPQVVRCERGAWNLPGDINREPAPCSKERSSKGRSVFFGS